MQTQNRYRWLVMAMALASVLAACPRPAEAFSWWGENDFDSLVRMFGLRFALIGRDLNGTGLNGQVLDERGVVSIALDQVTLSGKTVSLALYESKLVRTGTNAKNENAKKVLGAQLTGLLDDGRSINLRLDGVDKSAEAGFGDVQRYVVTYQTDDGWQPLCGLDDTGEPVRAVALAGRWNYTEGADNGGAWIDNAREFTFACEGFVLSKCVYAGYKPWRSTFACDASGCGTRSLRAHHQACTRAMRADYCGDGRSFTVDDTEIDLYDGLLIRLDSDQWNIEAEWDADGAICLDRGRLEGHALPDCAPYLEDDECGDFWHFYDGTLLISEVP